MNKYQRFAVNHYLQDYDRDMNFNDLTDSLFQEWNEAIPFEIYESSLSMEEIADNIIQMASDLEELA